MPALGLAVRRRYGPSQAARVPGSIEIATAVQAAQINVNAQHGQTVITVCSGLKRQNTYDYDTG